MNICLWQVVSRLFYISSSLYFIIFFPLPNSSYCFGFSGALEMLSLWVHFYSAEGELELKIPRIWRGGVVQ